MWLYHNINSSIFLNGNVFIWFSKKCRVSDFCMSEYVAPKSNIVYLSHQRIVMLIYVYVNTNLILNPLFLFYNFILKDGAFMNLEDIKPLKTLPVNKRGLDSHCKGVLTIVNSKKNGKRIEILESLSNELDLEDDIQIGVLGNGLVLSKSLPNVSQHFSLKTVGKKRVIYSSELVKEIIDVLNLSFEGRVSRTLRGIELEENQGVMLARVFEEGDC